MRWDTKNVVIACNVSFDGSKSRFFENDILTNVNNSTADKAFHEKDETTPSDPCLAH